MLATKKKDVGGEIIILIFFLVKVFFAVVRIIDKHFFRFIDLKDY